jgi:ribonuclease R
MLVSSDGTVTAYQFYPAVICSHARFTYNEVAAILANTHGPEAAKRRELVPHLLHLHEVYRALLGERQRRGAIDFETTETQIVCDDNGRIEKIIPRTRNDAHRLIEEAMLAANTCSADFIQGGKHHSLYRVHEGPTPEKRQTLQNYLRSLGISAGISDDPSPREFQQLAQATKDRADAQQIHTMLLRSMQQAIYTGTNSGHFGLAYPAYTHFTSPIRRYPDLLVHRVIKCMLAGKRYTLDASKMNVPQAPKRPGRPPPPNPADARNEAERWEVVGAHCSANERRADEASRDVEAWLKCRYMRDRLGEEFAGTVSAVTSFGLFVQLDALYVEGLVHITELGGEYFKFDDVRQELRGERTGIRYATGARVQVQVSRVDLDGRRIDFRLVRDSDEARVLSRGAAAKPSGKSSGKTPAKKRTPKTAVETLEDVRQADRDVKQSRKAAVASLHPVKAAQQAAKRAASKAAKKTASKPSPRKRR